MLTSTKSIRHALALLLCVLLLPVPLSLPLAALSDVSADCAILMDADSGRIIWQKNADQRRGMASTTKIMTALVAMQTVELDRVIEVAPAAVGIEGSSVYLYAGEQLTMEELLYAMLLESANDAAAAIAIASAGSIEAFADAMNRCAEELGLTDTHFTNPHGLWDENHYTTARELAEITRVAMQLPAFRTMVATYKKNIPLNRTEGIRLLINHNRLLKQENGIIGVKTGYTKKSGRCLVSAAERNGVTLVAVTLNAPDDWNDHIAMLEYGFAHSVHYALGNAADLSRTVPVVGGITDYVTVTNTAPLSVTLSADAPPPVLVFDLPRMLYAPLNAHTVVGCVRAVSGGTTVAESPLVACFSVERPVKRSWFDRLLALFAPK
ncbi:MAG: D-alanyl-D-alanine carboxypeptidase [Clostridia bacterium]|nr:D-alanyl-D-alanine carboxypeptidase [Clostridia bacterium]